MEIKKLLKQEGQFFIEPVNDVHEVMQFLEDKIYEHNSSKVRWYDGNLFCKIIRDENKNIIAGVGGWTWAHIAEITQLWVHESVRKSGLGQMLLGAVEAEAERRGCHSILVRSYSFQAPDFYTKYGYDIEHVVNDFPSEHKYYFLLKRLSGGS